MRFVVPGRHHVSGVNEGLFDTAYRLRKEGDLLAHELELIDENLAWFDANLEAPLRFNRTKSKARWHKSTKGICWYRASAHEHIRRMREIAHVLNENGYFVSELKTDRPGFIVFEDAYQIVAEPFADTPTSW